jgi:beta-N-acetylhexosaminidase
VIPVIYGCGGLTLTPDEQKFFSRVQPLGFSIFERNCQSPTQLKALIAQLKACVNHTDVPILIDQEGGRVVRLKPPHWQPRPAASSFTSADAVYENAKSIAQELLELGITVNCVPCADLLIEGADGIIGDRCFGPDPERVIEFSTAMLKGTEDGGVTGVIKHIPGPHAILAQTDFVPFKALAKASTKAWGMTAHVIYSDLDPVNVATQSKHVIDTIIRGEIGFKGFLVGDSLIMKSLSSTYAEKARKSLAAGCDAVLMCKGTLEEFEDVARGCA